MPRSVKKIFLIHFAVLKHGHEKYYTNLVDVSLKIVSQPVAIENLKNEY